MAVQKRIYSPKLVQGPVGLNTGLATQLWMSTFGGGHLNRMLPF